MWNLKKSKMNKQNKNGLIDTKNKPMVGVGSGVKKVRGTQSIIFDDFALTHGY